MQHICKDGCYYTEAPATGTGLTESGVRHEAPQQRQGLLRESQALPPQSPSRRKARRLALRWARLLTPYAEHV